MFTNIRKQKELIDREVELYKKEKFLSVDKTIEDYRFKRQSEIQDLAKRYHEELGRYEHDYHWTKEQKGIELAKLEAKNEALAEVVKAREEVIKADNNLLLSKDAEIKRLNEIVTLLIKEQPKHTTTIQQLK
jgi:hypothetical protein